MSETQESTQEGFKKNLEKLCCIIEQAYRVRRLSITNQSAMCDFPCYVGATEKVSAAVGFEVKDGDLLVDIARRMTSETGAAPGKGGDEHGKSNPS